MLLRGEHKEKKNLNRQLKLLRKKLAAGREKLGEQPANQESSSSLSLSNFLNKPKVARVLENAKNAVLLGLSLNYGYQNYYQPGTNSTNNQLNLTRINLSPRTDLIVHPLIQQT